MANGTVRHPKGHGADRCGPCRKAIGRNGGKLPHLRDFFKAFSDELINALARPAAVLGDELDLRIRDAHSG